MVRLDRLRPDIKNSAAPYSLLAPHYAHLMRHVPYRAWARFTAAHAGAGRALALDLFAGVGTFAHELSHHGFQVLSIDKSRAMLKQNTRTSLEADATEIPLAQGSAQAVTAVNCALHYLESEKELGCLFVEVGRVLKPGGIFVFDYCSIERAMALSGEILRSESIVLEHHFVAEEQVLQTRVEILHEATGVYETHNQRIFSDSAIKNSLTAAGFSELKFAANYDLRPTSNIPSIMAVVARSGA